MKKCFDSMDRDAIRARAMQMLDHADQAGDAVGRWADLGLKKARGFSLFDFAVLKLCLLSLGLWIGSNFSNFFRKIRGALFLLFAASWLYLIWRIVLDDEG